MPSNNANVLMNFIMSSLLNKIIVPVDFHNRVKVVKEMLQDDVSGLVDSLTDFAVGTASVNFGVETNNDELNKVLKNWLININSGYNGRIPRGIKALAEEYFKERWKSSSFPILKITKWDFVNGYKLPTKMFFVDGESIHAKSTSNDNTKSIIAYDYFLGSNKEDKLDKGVIITKPYGRWFDEYPVPYLIKRGIYHNWKIIQSLKNKETEILEQVIPYLFLVKKGSEALATQNIKTYSQTELKQIVDQFQTLMTNLKADNNLSIKSPIRASQFDEEIKHLIPDLSSLFAPNLFASAEKNILSGLGFVDVVEAVSTSRRESILNPKGFIEETKKGVEDFKEILRELVSKVIEENKDSHPKHMSKNIDFYITSSPVKGFMTEEFKDELRMLWKNGQLSNQTYCEMVGEVDFRTEVARREKEVKDGTEIIMYPHQTQNREDTESFEEIKRQKDLYEEEKEDKNGKPLPPDKTEPEQKEDYDTSKSELEGSPYTKISQLPSRVKNNLDSDLQSVFMKVFNNAYKLYQDETRAFRVAWSVIRKLGRKGKDGKWHRKRKRSEGKLKGIKLDRTMLEEVLEKEEKQTIEEAMKLKEIEIKEKQSLLLDKLIKGNK